MSREQGTITIGARVFDATGERIGTVDGITGDTVDVSGRSIPLSAFVRTDATGHHLDIQRDAASAGGPVQGATTGSDSTATEQDLMNRSVEEARTIEPPPPATGTLADPVAGSGFVRHQPAGENLLGDTTVSQPFEDLEGLDGEGTDGTGPD